MKQVKQYEIKNISPVAALIMIEYLVCLVLLFLCCDVYDKNWAADRFDRSYELVTAEVTDNYKAEDVAGNPTIVTYEYEYGGEEYGDVITCIGANSGYSSLKVGASIDVYVHKNSPNIASLKVKQPVRKSTGIYKISFFAVIGMIGLDIFLCVIRFGKNKIRKNSDDEKLSYGVGSSNDYAIYGEQPLSDKQREAISVVTIMQNREKRKQKRTNIRAAVFSVILFIAIDFVHLSFVSNQLEAERSFVSSMATVTHVNSVSVHVYDGNNDHYQNEYTISLSYEYKGKSYSKSFKVNNYTRENETKEVIFPPSAPSQAILPKPPSQHLSLFLIFMHFILFVIIANALNE